MTIGLVLGSTDKARLFPGIAIAFFLLALPCFFFVRERGHAVTARVFHIRDLVQSITTTVTTLRQGQRFPGLSRFLFGRLFYTDAINTVVTIMTLYAVDLGVSHGPGKEHAARMSELVLLGAIGCAVVGGFSWGGLVDRIGSKRTLSFVLLLWMADLALAALMGLEPLPLGMLYIVTSLAGVDSAGRGPAFDRWGSGSHRPTAWESSTASTAWSGASRR